MNRFIAPLVAATVSCIALTGCAPIFNSPDRRVHSGDSGEIAETSPSTVRDAIGNSDHRILNVLELEATMNGFAHGVKMVIELDTADPVSAQTLENIVRATYRASDEPKPTGASIVATSSNAAVDLRQAAQTLVGADGWNKYGASGVSILSKPLREIGESNG